MPDDRIDFLRLLLARMERLSVDSIWARRASGLRRSLFKAIEAAEAGQELPPEQVEALLERSFMLLRKAAQQIPDWEAEQKRFFPRTD